MKRKGIDRAGLVRLVALAVLLAGVVGLSLETQVTPGNVVAAKGKGHGSGHGHAGEGDKKDKKPKPEKTDKPDKKGEKEKKEEKPKKDHGNDAEQVPLEPVQFVAVEPSTVATEPSTVVVDDQPGSVVVQGFACPFVAVPDDPSPPDWFTACAESALGAKFELTALDGDNAGWQRTETVDADGVLRANDLAPGHYQLVQIDADWCHAESDRVDDQGNVIVNPGEQASVWIFDCLPDGSATPAPEPV